MTTANSIWRMVVIPSSFISMWNGIGKQIIEFIRLRKMLDIKSKPDKWMKFTYRIEFEHGITNIIRWPPNSTVSFVAVDDFSWIKIHIESIWHSTFDTFILSLWLNLYEHWTIFDVHINEKTFNLIELHHVHTRNLLTYMKKLWRIRWKQKLGRQKLFAKHICICITIVTVIHSNDDWSVCVCD